MVTMKRQLALPTPQEKWWVSLAEMKNRQHSSLPQLLSSSPSASSIPYYISKIFKDFIALRFKDIYFKNQSSLSW